MTVARVSRLPAAHLMPFRGDSVPCTSLQGSGVGPKLTRSLHLERRARVPALTFLCLSFPGPSILASVVEPFPVSVSSRGLSVDLRNEGWEARLGETLLFNSLPFRR